MPEYTVMYIKKVAITANTMIVKAVEIMYYLILTDTIINTNNT